MVLNFEKSFLIESFYCDFVVFCKLFRGWLELGFFLEIPGASIFVIYSIFKFCRYQASPFPTKTNKKASNQTKSNQINSHTNFHRSRSQPKPMTNLHVSKKKYPLGTNQTIIPNSQNIKNSHVIQKTAIKKF
jgi:hypothetical protein